MANNRLQWGTLSEWERTLENNVTHWRRRREALVFIGDYHRFPMSGNSCHWDWPTFPAPGILLHESLLMLNSGAHII